MILLGKKRYCPTWRKAFSIAEEHLDRNELTAVAVISEERSLQQEDCVISHLADFGNPAQVLRILERLVSRRLFPRANIIHVYHQPHRYVGLGKEIEGWLLVLIFS